MVRGSVYPCRVASRKEKLLVQLGCVGTDSTVPLEWGGVEEKGQTHHEEEEYFLHFTSQPKHSSRQVAPVSGRTPELPPEFDFRATSGGSSPDHRNGERCCVLGGAPCSKH